MPNFTTVAETFFNLIKTGKVDQAFHSASSEFQTNASSEDFSQFLLDTGLSNYADMEFGEAQVEGDQAGLQAIAKLANGQSLPILIYFKKAGPDWQIHNLTPAANPVTNAPIPDPAALTSLVHQYMALFALANQQGDFTAFYNLLADLWKVETTPEKLKASFQEFLNLKIDLGFIMGAAPVIGEPPVLNQQGFLVIKGYYPSAERHLVFDLTFSYQHPDWKLASINVSSHKLNPNG